MESIARGHVKSHAMLLFLLLILAVAGCGRRTVTHHGTPSWDKQPDQRRILELGAGMGAAALADQGRRDGLEAGDGLDEQTRHRLREDLAGRPELIPFQGTLGGSMGFYDPDRIRVLNERWVLAYFEDGHVAGQMVLSYTIDEDGSIHWRVLDAFLK